MKVQLLIGLAVADPQKTARFSVRVVSNIIVQVRLQLDLESYGV